MYDEIDFQRASQAYLWALPLMAMQQWQAEQHEKFGAGNLDYVDYLTFTDKLGLLTANATTPYLMAFPKSKETGPLVMEVPAGATAGGITDFWQRPITDSGQTGPEKGEGGKYLVLGPDDPDMKPEGYYVVRSPTVNVWMAQRALDPDPVKSQGERRPHFASIPTASATTRRPPAHVIARWPQMERDSSRADWPIGKACPKSSMRSPSSSATA